MSATAFVDAVGRHLGALRFHFRGAFGASLSRTAIQTKMPGEDSIASRTVAVPCRLFVLPQCMLRVAFESRAAVYSAMAPGGAGGYPSTSVALSRWSALAEQLSLTTPIGVQFTALWACIWCNYLNLIMADQPQFLRSCRAAPIILNPVPGGGTRAT
eukprot:3632288-Amphidinium_carterae.1